MGPWGPPGAALALALGANWQLSLPPRAHDTELFVAGLERREASLSPSRWELRASSLAAQNICPQPNKELPLP